MLKKILSALLFLVLACNSSLQAFAKAPTFADVKVLNQHGESLNFYSDLVQDKVVAINFIFTRCTMVCPMLGYHFGQLRQTLGEKAGKQVHLISISIDPVNDSPERLKAWSDQFNSGPGWTQVTGNKVAIDELLKSLQSFVPDINDHSTLVLVGDDKRQNWQRVEGFSSSEHLLKSLQPWL